MKRTAIHSLITVLGLLVFTAALEAADTTWTGASVVDNTDWQDGDNWDNGVPGINDRAIFNIAATVSNVDSAFVGQIQVDTNDVTIDIDGITLTLNSASPAVEVTGGATLTIAGTTGNFESGGESVDIDGTSTLVFACASVDLTGSTINNNDTIGFDVTNNGMTVTTGGAALGDMQSIGNGTNQATFDQLVATDVDIDTGGRIEVGSQSVNGNATITGNVTVTGNGVFTVFGNADFAGNLDFTGALALNIAAASGAIATFSSGGAQALVLNDPDDFLGGITLDADTDLTVTLSPTPDTSSNAFIVNGNLVLSMNATMTVNDGGAGGKANFVDDTTLNAGTTLTVNTDAAFGDAVTINGTATVELNGDADFTNVGTFDNDGLIRFNGAGAQTLTPAPGFDMGAVTIANTADEVTVQGEFDINSGTLTINAGAILTMQATLDLTGGAIVNGGTLRCDSSLFSSIDIVTDGESMGAVAVTGTSGQVTFDSLIAGAFTLSGNGSSTLVGGAMMLSGALTVGANATLLCQGNVTANGAVAFNSGSTAQFEGGTSDFNGTFTVAAGVSVAFASNADFAGATMANSGTLTFSSGDTQDLTTAGAGDNMGSITVNNGTELSVLDAWLASNTGTFFIDFSTEVFFFDTVNLSGVALINSGRITFDSGILGATQTIASGTNGLSQIVVTGSANGASFTDALTATSLTVSGSSGAAVEFAAATTISGAVSSNRALQLTGAGDFSCATFTASAAAAHQFNQAATFNGAVSLATGVTLEAQSMTLNGNLTMAVGSGAADDIEITGGTLTLGNSATTAITVTLGTDVNMIVNGNVVIAGDVNWTSNNASADAVQVSGNFIVNQLTTGSNGQQIEFTLNDGRWEVSGTFTVTGDTDSGETGNNAVFTMNDGLMRPSGNVTIGAGASSNAGGAMTLNGGSFEAEADFTVAGSATAAQAASLTMNDGAVIALGDGDGGGAGGTFTVGQNARFTTSFTTTRPALFVQGVAGGDTVTAPDADRYVFSIGGELNITGLSISGHDADGFVLESTTTIASAADNKMRQIELMDGVDGGTHLTVLKDFNGTASPDPIITALDFAFDRSTNPGGTDAMDVVGDGNFVDNGGDVNASLFFATTTNDFGLSPDSVTAAEAEADDGDDLDGSADIRDSFIWAEFAELTIADVSSGGVNNTTIFINQSAVLLASFTLEVTQGASVEVDDITVTVGGTVTSVASVIGNLRLWRDSDASGTFDSVLDTAVGSQITTGAASLTFSGPLTLTTGAPVAFFLVGDMLSGAGAEAQGGNTLVFSAAQSGITNSSGAVISGGPSTVTRTVLVTKFNVLLHPSQPSATQTVSIKSGNKAVFALSISNTQGPARTITAISFEVTAAPAGSSAALLSDVIDQIRLFADGNAAGSVAGDGNFNGGTNDAQLGATLDIDGPNALSVGTNTLTFSGFSLTVPVSSSRAIYLLATFNGGAPLTNAGNNPNGAPNSYQFRVDVSDFTSAGSELTGIPASTINGATHTAVFVAGSSKAKEDAALSICSLVQGARAPAILWLFPALVLAGGIIRRRRKA